MAKENHQYYGAKPDVSQQKQLQTTQVHQQFAISGPLPHSSEFSNYEATLPGAANRILSMAERETVHRQSLDIKVVEAGIRQSSIGQWLGFICVLASGGLIAYGIHEGAPLSFIPGTITGLASLVAVFTSIGKKK
jgi:uncharacterized membrane protein